MSKEYELEDIQIEQTSNLMQKLKDYAQKLKQLQWEVIQCTEALNKAEKKYMDFARKEMPMLFRMNNIEEIRTDDDTLVRIATKTTCSINKNDADKQNVAKWLKEHEGEDYVKIECTVPSSQIEKLKEAGIIYSETLSMNTNSVKAFLIDQLGQKGGEAKISLEDIPKGINFFQYDEMEVLRK